MTLRPQQPRPLLPSHRGERFRLTPIDMDRFEATADQVEAIQRISLSIFTDMSNNGFSLREALAAIYVSGLSHAISVITKETL